MKTLSEIFCEAAQDYLYLLDRDYPQGTLVKLIGDRYQLSGTERSMLYRGIASSRQSAIRKDKLAKASDLKSGSIAIDACNVLITIGSYLNGNVVFISNDHFLRDASEIHGKAFRTDLIHRSLNLLLDFLVICQPSEVRFYIDSPISFSGKLAFKITQELAAKNITGSAETHPSPDFLLKSLEHGIIATSDSTIIDKTTLPVFDLTIHVLRHHFNPSFVDLRVIQMK